MSTQHTPGPMRLDEEAEWLGGCRVICGPDGQELARTSGLYDDAEDLANARLFAAAPELLGELQEVLEWAIKEREPLREQEIKSISALIAKATRSAA